MTIRFACSDDIDNLLAYDCHISKSELQNSINLKRVIIAEFAGELAGWLRWSMFWDSIPFMNMLFVLEEHRNVYIGKMMVKYWEAHLKKDGYDTVMTSTLSNESAQNFYRKLGYSDCGCLMMEKEALEIIFKKNISQ